MVVTAVVCPLLNVCAVISAIYACANGGIQYLSRCIVPDDPVRQSVFKARKHKGIHLCIAVYTVPYLCICAVRIACRADVNALIPAAAFCTDTGKRTGRRKRTAAVTAAGKI